MSPIHVTSLRLACVLVALALTTPASAGAGFDPAGADASLSGSAWFKLGKRALGGADATTELAFDDGDAFTADTAAGTLAGTYRQARQKKGKKRPGSLILALDTASENALRNYLESAFAEVIAQPAGPRPRIDAVLRKLSARVRPDKQKTRVAFELSAAFKATDLDSGKVWKRVAYNERTGGALDLPPPPPIVPDLELEVTPGSEISIDAADLAPGSNHKTHYAWRKIAGEGCELGKKKRTRRTLACTASSRVDTLAFELTASNGKTKQGPLTVLVFVMADPANATFAARGAADLPWFDATAPLGSRRHPHAFLRDAIQAAGAGGDVYVMKRNDVPDAAEQLLGGYAVLPDDLSLYGGFDPSWLRDVDDGRTLLEVAGDAPLELTPREREVVMSGMEVVVPPQFAPTGARPVAVVHAEGAGSTSQARVRVEDSAIVGRGVFRQTTTGQPTGASNHAFVASGLAALTLRRSQLVAGPGGYPLPSANGAAGADGADGADADKEHGGKSGSIWSDGGNAGLYAWDNGARGVDGPGGAVGGAGGRSVLFVAAVKGGAGSNTQGIRGRSGGSRYQPDGLPFLFDSFSAFVHPLSGQPGRAGIDGWAGAGGGGGYANAGVAGGGGGEGGGGGFRGEPAQEGFGGGHSVGLLVHDVAELLLVGNSIASDRGAPGGRGGVGGRGGAGGAGGKGAAAYEGILGIRGGDGADGGRGGAGGFGGSGGGGAGGSSFGILLVETDSLRSARIEGNTLMASDGGAGGDVGDNGVEANDGDSFGGEGGFSYAVFADDAAAARSISFAGNALSFGQPGAGGEGGNALGAGGRRGEKNF